MRLLIAIAFVASCKKASPPATVALPPSCGDYRQLMSRIGGCSRIAPELRSGLSASFRKFAASWTDGAMTPDRQRAFDAACIHGMESARLAAHACFEVEAPDPSPPTMETRPETQPDVDPTASKLPPESAVAGKLPAACEALRVMIAKLSQCARADKNVRAQFVKAYEALEQGWKDFDKLPPEARRSYEDQCKQAVDTLNRASLCRL